MATNTGKERRRLSVTFTSSRGANQTSELALRSRLAVREEKGCGGGKDEKVGKEKKKAPPLSVVTEDRYASWLMFQRLLKEEKGRTPHTVRSRVFLASWSLREMKEYMAIVMCTAHNGSCNRKHTFRQGTTQLSATMSFRLLLHPAK